MTRSSRLYPTPAHQEGSRQRYDAARTAADKLTRAARTSVIDAGHDPRHLDTVVTFSGDQVAEAAIEMAPCGERDCVIGGLVMLAGELSVRLAREHRNAALLERVARLLKLNGPIHHDDLRAALHEPLHGH